jgi:tRNA threonylcarbamoyladenosine biosynthesis protein TsaE
MIIDTPQAMHDWGKACAETYSKVLLSGPLGAGKTTFAKGYAEGLGIDPDQVHSPTFTYINIYDDKLLHIDMYRLEQSEDLTMKGILDVIDEYDHIIIERPKRTEQYVDSVWQTMEIIKNQ